MLGKKNGKGREVRPIRSIVKANREKNKKKDGRFAVVVAIFENRFFLALDYFNF